MKRPDFTPEQLAKLNEIFGENKTQRITYAAGKGTESQPELSPAQRLLASPEAVRLRERGYDERETLDALTRQLMMPGKDIISSLPDKRYKAPEIDPTVLPGDTPTYTTLTGDVLTKDDADMDKWTAWRREPENAEALFRMETGKSSAQYEKELREDLRREVTGILERANSRIGQTEKRVAEAVGGGPVGTLAKARIYGMPKMAKGGKDADLAVMAKRILGQLDSKTAKDRDEGDKSSGLWRGIKNNLTAEDFLSAGYSSILENLLEARTLDKAHRGEKLTETEQDVLRLKGLEQRVNDYLALRGGKTRGAKVGEGLAHSAPFMAQFGLTSGIGSMPSVGRAVAGKLLQSGVKKGVAKGVGAVARMGAEAGKMLPLQAAPYNNYLERTAEQYRIGDDGTVSKLATPAFVRAYKGLADAYVDVFTEKTGEGFGVLFRSLVGRPVAQLARTMGLAQYMNRIPRSAALDAFRKRVGFNGAVGEFLEEVEGNFLAPLLTGETERWKEGFSIDNLWTTFLTTSVMSAGFASLELPGAADYARRSARLHVAEKKALAGIGNPELKTAVFAAMQQPTLARQSQALAGIDWTAPGLTGMDAAHAVDYARFRTQRAILNGTTRGLAQAGQIENIYRTLQEVQYRGADGQTVSGEFVTARGQDGAVYTVLAGGLETGEIDTNLFVLDEQGNTHQISRTELDEVFRVPVGEFVAEQYRQQNEAQEAELRAEQAQEDVQTGIEAGITPEDAARIVAPEAEPAAVTSPEPEEAPGSGLEGSPAGKAAIPVQGAAEVIPEAEAAQVSVPSEVSEAPAAPEQSAGARDQYSNEDAVTLMDGRQGVIVGHETGGYVVELTDGTFEKVPYNGIAGSVEPEVSVQDAPAASSGFVSRRRSIRKKVSPFAAKAAALGDYVSIEDVILRDIAGGLRFLWGNAGNRRGLAVELGLTDKESERRQRIGILSSDGLTPENYAEQLYFEYGAGNENRLGIRWNLDDKQIKDAVLGVLSRVVSPRQAYEQAVKLHGQGKDPYADYTAEDFAEMEQHEAARRAQEEELLNDSALTELYGQTTPAQWAEIDSLFAANSTDFEENANFGPLAEQSETAIDRTNSILSNENRTETADRGFTEATVSEDHRHTGGGQRSDTPTGNRTHQGEPATGTPAIRHESGRLEPLRSGLTDAEREVADETAGEIDTRSEEQNAALRDRLSQYAAEQREIGGALNEGNQGTLFGASEKRAADGNLFDVPHDLSKESVSGDTSSLQTDIAALENRRQEAIDDTVAAPRIQQEIPERTESAADGEPSGKSAAEAAEGDGIVGQKSTARQAQVEKEYQRYYRHAVGSFGDRIFDIRDNSLIKAGFVRDVLRLAKSDVEAAIRLVEAVNEAAVKYGGKPVLTPRHKIHRELAEMRARRSEKKSGGVAFAPVEKIKHTKTGNELYAVKLAGRVEAEVFGQLRQKAKEYDGYYSKFSRAFLFSTPEDAEAFRAEPEKNTIPAENPAGISDAGKTDAQQDASTSPVGDYGANNKIVTAEQYEVLRQRMREKLAQLNSGFDPEILSIGTQMAMYHIEAGARKFADFARRMLDDLGDAVRPYLKPIYIAAMHMPGMEELSAYMDSHEDVMRFDFDKPDATHYTQNDDRAAETEATTVRKQENTAEFPDKTDNAETGIDGNIALLGYYDRTGETEKDISEYGSLRPEKNFKKDLVAFSKALSKVLGWEHDADRKGKPIYANINLPPAGGEGTFILWKPGTDYGVYVSVTVKHPGYVTEYGYSDDLQIEKRPYGDILWRITSRGSKYRGYDNFYAPADITASQLAALVNKEIKNYIRRENENRVDGRVAASVPKTDNYEQNSQHKDGQIDRNQLGTDSPAVHGGISAGGTARHGGNGTGRIAEGHREAGRQRDGLGADIAEEGRRAGRGEGNGDATTQTELATGKSGANRGERNADTTDYRQIDSERHNYEIIRGTEIAPRGETAKIKANIEAIRLVKQLEQDERPATIQEKNILVKYTGWGGLSSVFKEEHPYYKQVKEALSESEYETARASTMTSFYTPPAVISSIWNMAEKLGFSGGSVLEPSAGIGHFFGLMPPFLQVRSQLTGVEIDLISGQILKALYPDADIRIEGFENQYIRNNSIDLVVTNVPFGRIKVFDQYDKDLAKSFDIHDYFIAKSIRKLKPGGLGIFITSTTTLDNSKKLREWVVNDGNADFLGAVRLNYDTFKSSAGTETSADIIVIRKRDENGRPDYAADMQDIIQVRKAQYSWEKLEASGIPTHENKTAYMIINRYFQEHPERMAGVMKFGFETGKEIHPAEQRCAAVPEIDQQKVIANFIESLPADIYRQAPRTDQRQEYVHASDGTKEGGLTVIDGKPCLIQYGSAVEVDWNSNKVAGRSKVEALKDYIALKNTLDALLEAENNDAAEIDALRQELNAVYDRFIARYGTLSNNPKIGFLRDDVDFPSIAAVENVKETKIPGNARCEVVITKSDIFSRRVIERNQQLKAETVEDGIKASQYRYGKLNIPFIAKLIGKPESEIEAELLEKRLAFINPATGLLEERSEYLSGNVRLKLTIAEQARMDGQYDVNIEELRNVVPLDLPLHLIKISLGSTWIPVKVYERFFEEKFLVKASITKAENGKYHASLRSKGNVTDQNMGIAELPGSTLTLNAMNCIQPVVYKSEYDPVTHTTKRVKDQEASSVAAAKQTELDLLFEQWCKTDGNPFAEEMVVAYNEKFNGTIEKRIDVSGFDYFPNASHVKKPRQHQKEGVIRALNGATLLAHEVGTGKTITLISTAMEMRRLGIAKKPCIVVQRATYEQFVGEIKSLYPAAKVLVPSAKDLTASQRQQLFAKIAYNDWDIVVLYHGYLDSIPDDPDRINAYIDGIIQEKLDLLDNIEASDPTGAKRLSFNINKEIESLENSRVDKDGQTEKQKTKRIKEQEKIRANADAKARQLLDRRTDKTLTFEKLGIDALLVDEAHSYKKLGFSTSLQNIKGIDPAASQKAQSMRLKTSYILEQNGGKNVVFATGTPISNTMAEMWTFLRYLLEENELRRYDLNSFDSFANNFGNIEESAEFNASGKFKVTNRFASFSNVPELLSIWKKVAHTVLTEEVSDLREGVGTPVLEGGKPTDLLLEQTAPLKSVMKSIRSALERYDKMRGKEKRENSHIPLVMFGLAKRAAIDVRLINPDLPDNPGSKLNYAVSEIIKDLEQTKEYRGTVAVFCDSYQSRDRRFNIFEDIKLKLEAAGIPAEQIAIINDYNNDKKRKQLFDRVNSGDIRVVLGTTEKLGVGVNMQKRLHLLVHMDVPIRPMDYQQRNGRILRQGNMHLDMNIPVRILRLGVKQTLDVTGYQRLQIKEKFIRQIMKGDISARMIEEEETEGSDANNFSQMMASLSGSQAALALSVERNKLQKLTNAAQYHTQSQIFIANKVKTNDNVITTTTSILHDLEKKRNDVKALFPDGRIVSLKIGKREATGQQAIEKLIKGTYGKRVDTEVEAVRKDAKRDSAKINGTIEINGQKFNIQVVINKTINPETLKITMSREYLYKCESLPELSGSVRAKLENVLTAVENYISTQSLWEAIEARKYRIERAKQENKIYRPQVGKPFPQQAELEKTMQRVEELQEQMAAELALIEAQEAEDNVEEIDIDAEIVADTEAAQPTDQSGENPIFRDHSENDEPGIPANPVEIERLVRKLAESLHIPVEIIRDTDTIGNGIGTERKRKAKGWYDTRTGKVSVVLPNMRGVADAEATVLHEAVGHMGLGGVLGERFGDFIDGAYKGMEKRERATVHRLMAEERDRRAEAGQAPLPAVEARRLATEEYLAGLAEGNRTPGRFARIIGTVRRWLREALGVPLRVGDRDIAYMLWLSRHRLASSRTAADAVRRTAAARRVKAALYGSASERYRIVMDETDPKTLERYCVAEWLKDHRLPGVELGEHWDEMARIVYDNATDLGRSVIHNLFGEEPLRATKRYMALRNIREITDREGLNRIIDKLTKVLPREKRQQIVDSQRKHLEFVLSDDYKSPLRRRGSKDEKPLPENFKYAAEFVEELLAKRKKQETIAPAGEIEPTVLYDKKKPLHVIESILLDSTMPVRKLQEEIIRRGGRIDDITDVYAHLNHYSSVTKVALQKYTDDYINPLLDRVAALASLTGADMDAVTDYISAESSLERDLSGVPALSPDPESDWNREVTEAMIKAFRELAGRKRVEAVERDGIGGIPAEERELLPAGLLDKVKRDGLASLDAAELSELREAPVASLWRAVNAANDRVLDLLVEDGMMAQETRKLVKGHNWKYYVPLRSYDYSVRDDKDDITRFDATEVYDFIATRRTPGRLRQVVQEAEGRFTKPFNPVVQMVNIGIGAVISAKTNRMRQSALRLAQNTKGGADLFRVNRVWLAKAVGNRWVMTTIDPSVEDIELSKAARKEIARLNKELQQAKKAHDEQGIAILEGQIKEAERYNIVRECRATDDGGEVFGREANVSPSLQRQRCVECYVNGIKYIVTFADPAVANAINGYHRLSIPQWVDDTVGNATRWLARAFTSLNPAFVAVNFLRDVQHAALIHTLDREGDLRGFVRHIMPGMAAISRNVQGKARPLTVADLKGADILTVAGRQRLVWLYGPTRVYDTLYDYFRENGGETGFVHGKSVKEAERDVRRYVAFRTGTVGQLLRNAKRSERPEIALSYAARRTGAKAVAEAFDRASRIAENTSRFATFVASLDQGKTLLRAISDAKNVTVNFNRRGTASRALGMFYVFFNASVQGAAQVARVALRNRRRFAAAVATMITGGFLESLLLDFFLASQDDDRNYISQYDRRNHLLVPYIGRHGYGKIPLPQGFRAFHGIGVLLHDAYKGKITAEECARSMWNVLYEDFSPVASPTDRGDLARVVVPTAATPFYDIWYAKEDTFGYPVGKRTFDDAPNYPLSEMGLKNVNRAILAFCRGLNALGGGDRDTPAGLRQSGEIDPLLRGLFEWNPSHVEHVLTYYGGGMGKFVKDVVHTVQSLVEPDAELNSYDLPIINRLYGTTRKENPANRYYTMKERMTNLAARYRRMGDRAETAGPEARRDLERVRLFREYDRIVNRIRKVMAGTNPGSAEYEKLQQELDATMREYLQTDERYVTGN